MFTGLIQGLGAIERVERRGAETRLTIRPRFDMLPYVIGESIAVNGACLTVEAERGGAFLVYASGETMSRTSLGKLATGAAVNLERALAMGDRLGGHMVSGHVDCLAEVSEVAPAGESRRYTLTFPREFGVFVVEKGSVALDGISLTVNACGDDWLSVNIIPETQANTTISGWTPGKSVNMETDLIGKYVLKMVGPWLAKAQGKGAGAAKPSGSISADFLRKHGF